MRSRMKPFSLATLAAVAAAVLAAQSGELKLDDIVRKSIEAQGGLEKMKAIKTLKLTGKMIVGGGQIEAPLTSYMKRPNRNRTEISLQGQLIVEAFDGMTKWSVSPLSGGKDPQKASEEDTKAAADDADLIDGPLVNYKDKGSTVELLGKEDVGGSMAYKVKINAKSGRVSTVFLDAKSFLAVKVVSKLSQAGQEFEAESLPANYKPVEGVMIAFSNQMKINQQIGMEIQFDKIEANVPVDDAMFVMPVVKKADPPKTQ